MRFFLLITGLIFLLGCSQKKDESNYENEFILSADSILLGMDLFDSVSRLNGYSKMIELYDESIQGNKDLFLAYDLKIDAQLRLGQHLEAIKSIEEVIVRDENRPDLLLLRGVLSEFLGFKTESDNYYLKAYIIYEDSIDKSNWNDVLNRFTVLYLYKGEEYAFEKFNEYNFDSKEKENYIEIVLNTDRKEVIDNIANP